MMDNFDYIIVGAGSAGCVLANRLSADGKNSVCLLEAGPSDWNPFIHIPAGFMKTLTNPSVNWLFKAEPSWGTSGRVIDIPRGKTLFTVWNLWINLNIGITPYTVSSTQRTRLS